LITCCDEGVLYTGKSGRYHPLIVGRSAFDDGDGEIGRVRGAISTCAVLPGENVDDLTDTCDTHEDDQRPPSDVTRQLDCLSLPTHAGAQHHALGHSALGDGYTHHQRSSEGRAHTGDYDGFETVFTEEQDLFPTSTVNERIALFQSDDDLSTQGTLQSELHHLVLRALGVARELFGDVKGGVGGYESENLGRYELVGEDEGGSAECGVCGDGQEGGMARSGT
jgi:hypothetical protein